MSGTDGCVGFTVRQCLALPVASYHTLLLGPLPHQVHPNHLLRTPLQPNTLSHAQPCAAAPAGTKDQRLLGVVLRPHEPPPLAAALDPKGHLLWVSASLAQALGHKPHALRGKELGALLPPPWGALHFKWLRVGGNGAGVGMCGKGTGNPGWSRGHRGDLKQPYHTTAAKQYIVFLLNSRVNTGAGNHTDRLSNPTILHVDMCVCLPLTVHRSWSMLLSSPAPPAAARACRCRCCPATAPPSRCA